MANLRYITRVISGVRFDKLDHVLEKIREKSGQGQTAETLQRVKFCCVGKYDGQHSGTLQHVEHADGADSAGLGSFHEQGPSLRLTPCSRSRRNVVELIKKTRVLKLV